MAKIEGLKEQTEALKKIELLLQELEIVNTFLETPNPSKKYMIRFAAVPSELKTDDKKAMRKIVKEYTFEAPAFSEDKHMINQLVLNQKNRIKDKILSLSKQYHISLDEKEMNMLHEK